MGSEIASGNSAEANTFRGMVSRGGILRAEALYKWFGNSGNGGYQFNAVTLNAIVISQSVKMELEAQAVSVRLLYANRSPNAQLLTTAVVGVTETNAASTNNERIQPIIGGTAYAVIAGATTTLGLRAVTWGGAATATVAAATTSQQFALSDSIPLSTVARADGGTRPLLLYRTEHDGAAQGSFAVCAISSAIATPSAPMRNRTVQLCAASAVTAVTTLSANLFASTNLWTEVYPVVRHKVPVLSVWGVGDSITQNNGIVADTLSSWVYRACLDVSTAAKPVVFANFGASGSTSADYLTTLRNALAAGAPPPSVIVTNSGSINDIGASPTDRNFETARSSFLQLIQLAADYNVPVIIAWPTQPYASLDSTEDAARKALNVEAKAIAAAYGITWISAFDFGTLGDGASPERWRSEYVYTTDGLGLHPNEACIENAMAPALAAILRTLIV